MLKDLTKKQKTMLYRILGAAALMIVISLLPLEKLPVVRFLLFLVPYFLVGYDVLLRAFRNIRNGQVFDEHFLMGVATIGAMILGDYTEAVAVMLFYQVGELFQGIAVGKSRKNISELMDICPDYANVETEDGIEETDPDDVEIGTVIVVKPGEKVPIDGVVITGSSTLNTAALTGESLPREVKEGDEIISGSINMTGLLRVRTEKEFGESTASKILELVENAASRKAKSEQFITKFARYYTPAVCYAALALAILGPLGSMLLGKPSSMALWGDWIYRALTFLVISCPCAILVSIPLSFFGGIGGASSQGILIKGSNFMETLADVKIVAFDKTGTVTKGNFEVTDVHHATVPREEFLELAAHAEAHSSHPISKSLQRAYGKEVDTARVSDVTEHAGRGLVANVDGKEVACGNIGLMEELGVDCRDCSKTGTIVHMSVDRSYSGHAVIADEIKPSAAEAIKALHKSGIRKTVMLTGDAPGVAESVAKDLGITEVHAGLMPADKVDAVEKLLAEKKSGEALAFVGDGINDAPVLSRADIGIAMGALGSDAAIEAADVVLMDDDPVKIAKAIRIARKCIRIVKQNLVFAIGVKLLCLLLGAVGIASMWLAIFADTGVLIICVLNAVRALMVKNA